MEDELPIGAESVVNEFATYEDYLDSQITKTDLYYLEAPQTETILTYLLRRLLLGRRISTPASRIGIPRQWRGKDVRFRVRTRINKFIFRF